MTGSGCGTGSSSGSGCSPGIGSSSGIGARCRDCSQTPFSVGSTSVGNGSVTGGAVKCEAVKCNASKCEAVECNASKCDAAKRDGVDRNTGLHRVMPSHAACAAADCERIVLCMFFPDKSCFVRWLIRSARVSKSRIADRRSQIEGIADCLSTRDHHAEEVKDDQARRRFGASHRDDRKDAPGRGASLTLQGRIKNARGLCSQRANPPRRRRRRQFNYRRKLLGNDLLLVPLAKY